MQGIFFIRAHVAGGLTPLAVMGLATFLDWRTIFVLFGAIGLVWAAAWYGWFRDHPAEHAAVNAAELAEIVAGRAPQPSASEQRREPGFWRRLLGTQCAGAVPDVHAQQFCLLFLHYLAASRLKEKHGLERCVAGDLRRVAAGLERIGRLLGGVTTDRAVRHLGPGWPGRC